MTVYKEKAVQTLCIRFLYSKTSKHFVGWDLYLGDLPSGAAIAVVQLNYMDGVLKGGQQY